MWSCARVNLRAVCGRIDSQAGQMQAPTIDTFTLPTLAERRNERSARVAYFAWVLTEHTRQFQGVPFELQEWRVIAACVSCGANTGNWCDTCELQGRHFYASWGQQMVGSPLCTRCETDHVCLICGA